jgi:hypothetical protein
MSTKVWIGKWTGGRMFAGKDGRPVYVLRKMIVTARRTPSGTEMDWAARLERASVSRSCWGE